MQFTICDNSIMCKFSKTVTAKPSSGTICPEENLADCVDSGGLPLMHAYHIRNISILHNIVQHLQFCIISTRNASFIIYVLFPSYTILHNE